MQTPENDCTDFGKGQNEGRTEQVDESESQGNRVRAGAV